MKKLILAVIILLSLTSAKYFSTKDKQFLEVVDGDTIKLNNQYIRLIGINAPEKGQYYFEEAKNRLEELIKGKSIKLEKDKEDKDSFGRLLRYVFADDIFVNLELVREGYAYVLDVQTNLKYIEQLKKAEEIAKEKKVGIWKKPYSFCISIEKFNFNAKGNDNSNLNDEYVVFKNNCDFSINLTNWKIKDKTNNTFIFSKFVLNPKSSFVLYSGSGENSETELYWNSKKAIWDNKKDTLFLFDDEDTLILKYSY